MNGNNGNGSRIGLISGIVIAAIFIIGGIIYTFNDTKSDIDDKAKEKLPSCEEIYCEALNLLNQRDSIHLQIQGKEKLRTLVEDSLYVPAKMKYYVLLLNSNSPLEVKKGFSELEKMAQIDTLNTTAMFECGLTLSKSNPSFNIPMIRQSHLGIEPDLSKANDLLIKVVESDTLDYKSAYWALSNLIEMKLAESNGVKMALPSDVDKQIVKLYKIFVARVKNYDDIASKKYKEAISKDKQILWNWNLIK